MTPPAFTQENRQWLQENTPPAIPEVTPPPLPTTPPELPSWMKNPIEVEEAPKVVMETPPPITSDVIAQSNAIKTAMSKNTKPEVPKTPERRAPQRQYGGPARGFFNQ